MANYQLTSGDSVVVTPTVVDDVTGATVTADAGSVSAALSSTTDTLVDNTDGTFTIVAGSVDAVGNTITVQAAVNGVACTPGVGTYDVVAVVTPPDATSVSVSFGTETPPAASTTTPVAAAGTDGVAVVAPEAPGTFRNS